MVSITPCQRVISDRFPVASFVVAAPPERLFEIACATDPTLFRGDQRHRRTGDNFFSTRLGGLMRAPAGQTTYLVPPEQLKRFAGARRLYYNAGSYASARGDDARFTVAPDAEQSMPSIQISPDFTGKTLDRARLGGPPARAGARYGARDVKSTELLWGGDLAAADARLGGGGAPATGAADAYDDGYSPDLWNQPPSRRATLGANEAPAAPSAEEDDDADVSVEPPGFEDAPDLRARGGAALGGGAGRAPARAAGASVLGEAPRLGSSSARAASASAPPRLGRPPAEPPGFEDGAAINRASRRPAGAPAKWTPERARGPRYGAVAYAAEDAAPAPATTAPLTPATPSPAPAAAAGRDDEYDDGTAAADEPELPADLQGSEVRLAATPVPLTIPEKFKIVSLVARGEGGAGRDGYAAVNADGEYNDPSHAFYHRRHVGLSWGIVQFTQLGGALGRVLEACQRRDPTQFAQTFGPDAAELLRVTGADEEGDRLQPVGASFLWEGDWPDRFRRAGQVPAFQAAQNEVAIEGYLDPNLPFAAALGWDTDRALALLYDRAVAMGNAGAQSWIIRAVGPIRTQKQRAAALAALGFPSFSAFCDSVPELRGDIRWTAPAHAALVGALRGLGPEAPIPLPTLDAQLDAVVAAAAGRRFAARLQRLRAAPELYDTRYDLVG
jgi:hypothetical protein